MPWKVIDMGLRDVGNPPIQSTGIGSSAIAVNASSGTVVAAIVGLQDRLYETRFTVGADTVAFWKLQHADATGNTLRNQKVVITGTNDAREYIYTFKAETSDQFRVVMGSAVGSSLAADIQAEVIS